MSQFIDQAFIEISSGDGGNGAIAWRRDKYEPMGGPAGGTGGRGGHIYMESTKDLNTLLSFKYQAKFLADNGQRGGNSSRSGKAAPDLTIKVPVGTLIKDKKSGKVVADLNQAGMRIMVAEGGRGGKGNAAFASPTRRAPYFCEPGQAGIKRKLELELKLLADVGLVGFPNAGKSTLLASVSQAKPKIAAYPFSTLEPILGVVPRNEGKSYAMADIPGLIEGASTGTGLGDKFLRHVERTRILLHLVDITAEDPNEQIKTINRELTLFNSALAEKEQLIVLTKCDLLSPEDVEKIKAKVARAHKKQTVTAISAATRNGLTQMASAIEKKLVDLAAKEIDLPMPELTIDEDAVKREDDSFVVSRQNKRFYVEGDRIARIVGVTDAKSPESLHHLNQVLRSMGVMQELINQEIKPGDDVQIGELSFTFGENMF